MDWDFLLPAPETEESRKIHCSSPEDGPTQRRSPKTESGQETREDWQAGLAVEDEGWLQVAGYRRVSLHVGGALGMEGPLHRHSL